MISTLDVYIITRLTSIKVLSLVLCIVYTYKRRGRIAIAFGLVFILIPSNLEYIIMGMLDQVNDMFLEAVQAPELLFL
jgi:hypothetical protein